MQGLLDDLGCSCWRRTLEAEEQGELTVFTCMVCIERARSFHGDGQLAFLFPEGERESSVSALVTSEGVKKKAALDLRESSDSLPF